MRTASTYGKLRVLDDGGTQWARIWRSRNEEPEPVELFEEVLALPDPATGEDIEFGRFAWEVARELPPKYLKVLEMRLKFDMTLEEAGDALGVTRERIRQIEAKSIRMMRGRMKKLSCAPKIHYSWQGPWEPPPFVPPRHCYDLWLEQAAQEQEQ